ncbi:MAG: hypothetical protein ACKVS8_06250 [Phycisphaerales bacterium]
MNNAHNPNPRSPMNDPLRTSDLYELASLDAMGVLDEGERKAFEAALLAATPAVQLQIRLQQARASEIEHLLPRVEAPGSLRQRVIDAVMHAVGTARQHEAGRTSPSLLPSRGVPALWRTLSVVCAAAAVAIGVANFQMRSDYREMEAAFMTNAATDVFIKEFGPKFEQALVSPATRFVQFNPAVVNASSGRSSSGMAVLLMNTETKAAQFYGKDLPENSGTYALVVLRPDGSLGQPLLTFKATGTKVVKDLDSIIIPSGSSLALTNVPADQPDTQRMLLRSNSL